MDYVTLCALAKARVPRIAMNEDRFCSPFPSPLSKAEEQAALDSLGFAPPSLLRSLYRDLGNGGFGPGYGLMGLAGGATDDMGQTADAAYLSLTKSGCFPGGHVWPNALLPIADFGCAIYACIDCQSEDFPVVFWEPNLFSDGDDPRTALFASGRGFSDWIGAWAQGQDIWAEVFGTFPDEKALTRWKPAR